MNAHSRTRNAFKRARRNSSAADHGSAEKFGHVRGSLEERKEEMSEEKQEEKKASPLRMVTEFSALRLLNCARCTCSDVPQPAIVDRKFNS